MCKCLRSIILKLLHCITCRSVCLFASRHAGYFLLQGSFLSHVYIVPQRILTKSIVQWNDHKPYLVKKIHLFSAQNHSEEDKENVNVSVLWGHSAKNAHNTPRTHHEVKDSPRGGTLWTLPLQHKQTTNISDFSLSIAESAKVLRPGSLSACCDATEGNELHGGLFQGVPAVVPCDPNNAVVVAVFTCILFRVPAT